MVWDVSALSRLRTCGRGAVDGVGGYVSLKVQGTPGGDAVAGFGGVVTCGSVWGCPVCAARIAVVRQAEIAQSIRTWHARGGRVVMVTLTMRHDAGQALGDLWDGLSTAWDRAKSGRAWNREREAYGIAHVLRAVEVTHGVNGWHVHVHALVYVDGARAPLAQALGAAMFGRWEASLRRQGFRSPSRRHGFDVRLYGGETVGEDWAEDEAEALGAYLVKSLDYSLEDDAAAEDAAVHAAWEMSRSDSKSGRHGNRTPFQLLRDLVLHGEARDEDLWLEWEQASHGRRQLVPTRDWRRDLLGDADELSDDEIAADDELDGGVAVELEERSFRELVRLGWDTDLLELAETVPMLQVLDWLDERLLVWRLPVDGPPPGQRARRHESSDAA